MRAPTMSGHFLLAPIPESSSDYLLPRDIKLAVLGAGRVGKSGERPGESGGSRRRGGRRGGPDASRPLPASPRQPAFPPLPRTLHSWALAGGHLLENGCRCGA